MVYKMQAIYGKLSMRGLHKPWKLLLYTPMNEWMNEWKFYLSLKKSKSAYIQKQKSINRAWKRIKSELKSLKSTSNYKHM